MTFWFSNVIEFPSLILSFFGFDESVGYQREKGVKKKGKFFKWNKNMFCEQFYFWISTQKNSGRTVNRTWTPLVTSVLFTIARRWKQPTHAYRHMGSQTDCVEYYSALKRKDILVR